MTLALSFIDSWITIAGAVGVGLCVTHVIAKGVDALRAWVQPAAEEAGKLREERGA